MDPLERQFRKTIKAEPAELAHRLVYADWLLDQGRPLDALNQRVRAGVSEKVYKIRRKSDGLFDAGPRWTKKGRLWLSLARVRKVIQEHITPYGRNDDRTYLDLLEIVVYEQRLEPIAVLPAKLEPPPTPEPGEHVIYQAGQNSRRSRYFEIADLHRIVRNFDLNDFRVGNVGPHFCVSLTIGNEEPAVVLARVRSLRLLGDQLLATFTAPTAEGAVILAQRAYRQISVEIYNSPPDDCLGEGPMLRRAAVILNPRTPPGADPLPVVDIFGDGIPEIPRLEDAPLPPGYEPIPRDLRQPAYDALAERDYDEHLDMPE